MWTTCRRCSCPVFSLHLALNNLLTVLYRWGKGEVGCSNYWVHFICFHWADSTFMSLLFVLNNNFVFALEHNTLLCSNQRLSCSTSIKHLHFIRWQWRFRIGDLSPEQLKTENMPWRAHVSAIIWCLNCQVLEMLTIGFPERFPVFVGLRSSSPSALKWKNNTIVFLIYHLYICNKLQTKSRIVIYSGLTESQRSGWCNELIWRSYYNGITNCILLKYNKSAQKKESKAKK